MRRTLCQSLTNLAHSRTCEKPLADGCGDLKGLRKHISSETLYSLGSIDLRLISSLHAAFGTLMHLWQIPSDTKPGTHVYRFVSIAAIFASLRCCNSLASAAASCFLEGFLQEEVTFSSEDWSDCAQSNWSSTGQALSSANAKRDETPQA